MLALLGWNPGTEQEIFTLDELSKAFSFDIVIKSGARFNPEKAKWFNEQYLRARTAKQLAAEFLPIAAKSSRRNGLIRNEVAVAEPQNRPNVRFKIYYSNM